MVYGPIAAFLVELFPTPHPLHVHVAALPHRQRLVRRHAAAAATAMVAATGDIYFGLWYPIVVALITVVIGMLFLHDTKDVKFHEDE